MNFFQAIQKLYQVMFGTVAAPTPVTGTSAVPVSANTFQVWTANTRIASITINGTAITSFSGVDLPSGFCVYGVITSITLSAGSGLAYTSSNTI